MTRVVFDIHAIGQHATGNETYADGLLQIFLANPYPDMTFVFYHSGNLSPQSARGNFRRLWPNWPYLRIPFSTPLALQRDHIDVAHFQYFAPPLSRSATVLTIHDLSFERHPEFFPRAMALRMKALMPLQARRATHIIAVSEATRRDIVDIYGIDPSRISVIHNGVLGDFDRPADAESVNRVRQRFGLTRPFVICVGNLGARKNQERIVRAFSHLVKNRGVDHDLVLVGNATGSAAGILAEIERGGLRERIHVAGFVARPELHALYSAATASVYVSLYEGFGLPILESMACGTPVLTSSVSCMPEIAGGAALLVDPRDETAIADAILRLISDADLRQRLAELGPKRAREFTWDVAARHTADVYRLAAQAAKAGQ